MRTRTTPRATLTLSVVAVALAGVVAGTASATAAGLLTVLDWETAPQQTVPGAPPPGWAAEYHKSLVHPDTGEPQLRIARAPEPVRAGSAAARFELHKNDPVINNGSRAELTAPLEPRGAERWYGFSVYLPSDWAHDRSAEIVTQWHQHWDIGSSPPLALVTRNGNWEISQNWESYQHQTVVGAYQTGLWTDWVFHVKWSSGDDGLVQIWKDGRPVTDFANKAGKNTYHDPNHGNYMKIGIYKWDWSQGRPSDTTRRVMYHDELRVADASGGYATVAPPG
jgi:Polysaccharide lyase